MKNIHILPTDKPSRLYDDGLELYLLIKASNSNNDLISYKNIYITIDEEIKEGDWHLVWLRDKWEVLDYMPSIGYRKECLGKEVCKVILTTDQDLIKDGVQAIDDEFLEWFVKNPSCEFVEVNKIYNDYGETDIFDLVCTPHSFNYQIIIPKEEPKYSVKKEYVDDQDAYGYDVIVKEKSKQETLEEAAEKYDENDPNDEYGKSYRAFIEGAKWQQEKSYNEQELKFQANKLLNNIFEKKMSTNIIGGIVNDWFDTFKKK